MEKNKINEANESLERIKLLMSYKNDMTLTENEKKVKGLINEGHADTVETVLNACTTAISKTKTLTDDEIQQLARNFYDAFEGFWTGTDLDKVKQGLNKLSENTLGDLCAVKEFFEKRYGQGDTFFDWIDSDIDYDDEWVDFVDTFQNLKEKHDKTTAETDKPEETQATNNNLLDSFKTFIKNTYPDAKVSDQDITINGNIYTIKQNGNEWDFKFENDTFTYQQ